MLPELTSGGDPLSPRIANKNAKTGGGQYTTKNSHYQIAAAASAMVASHETLPPSSSA